MSDTRARDFYDSPDAARWGRSEMPEQHTVTQDWIERTRATGPSLELGCGRGALAGAAPRYAALDLSFHALATAHPGTPRIAASMEELPIRSGSIGLVFSWAAIEHVPNPDVVLVEIERVLRPGGVAILAPAWHCRPWAADGLEFRRYSELSGPQKARKALIPLRNALWWRALFEIPRRLLRELEMLMGPTRFRFTRLKPNLDEYVGTDCDAFTSMDPHAMIVYFASRGWEIISNPGLRSRLLARHGAVVVRKPGISS
ncbi:MAG TPA: class I SAM-dependent methyltransferase [Thermoanaerobaculia bacterium]